MKKILLICISVLAFSMGSAFASVQWMTVKKVPVIESSQNGAQTAKAKFNIVFSKQYVDFLSLANAVKKNGSKLNKCYLTPTGEVVCPGHHKLGNVIPTGVSVETAGNWFNQFQQLGLWSTFIDAHNRFINLANQSSRVIPIMPSFEHRYVVLVGDTDSDNFFGAQQNVVKYIPMRTDAEDTDNILLFAKNLGLIDD